MPRLFFVILFFAICPTAFADWSHVPAAIDPSASAANLHHNSGGRRMVRVNDVLFSLVNSGSSDHIYRSTDNGNNWNAVDTEFGYSGSLVSGTDNYIYHFSRYGSDVRMVKFLYSETSLPAPVSIFDQLGSSNHGAYTMVNGTVNQNGDLFVFFHYDTGTGGDSLFMIRSLDDGISWSSPVTVAAGSDGHSFGFAHSDVTPDGEIVIVYAEWGDPATRFAISSDSGASWTTTLLSSVSNPAVLPVGDDVIYVFGQGVTGLDYRKSVNNGATWTDWISIDSSSLSNYADPSPALGDDGSIYVSYRSGARPDLANVYGGSGLRWRMTMSIDGGQSWTFPDNYFYDENGDPTPRTGTRNPMRYQTWHNYGGPLEWTWLQANADGDYLTFYDNNLDVSIYSLDVENTPPILPPLLHAPIIIKSDP